MIRSMYIDKNSLVKPPSNKSVLRYKTVISALLTLMMLVFSTSALIFGSTAEAADDVDIVKKVVCNTFEKDTLPNDIYQWTQTSELWWKLRSKSAVVISTEEVSSAPLFLNDLLEEAGGFSFNEINGSVLGHPIDSVSKEEFVEKNTKSEEEKKETYNKGPQYNFYQRFGVAGLNFSSYIGEWKYVVVDACAENPVPADPQAGLFYKDRLVPKSTWEDVDASDDARSVQFEKFLPFQTAPAFLSNLANIVFFGTKTVVVSAITLIYFSFDDISGLAGINELLTGDSSGNKGIFKALYDGIFTPFVFLMFFLTGVNILWSGIVKRQIRKSFTDFARSIGMLILAVFLALYPQFFIQLPNTIAITVQSAMIGSMTTSVTGGNGLCDATVEKEIKDKDDPQYLDSITKNMNASLGCTFWYQFLLKPWSQGQFGADWNELWANTKDIPKWAIDNGASTYSNTNEKMVGDAAVPLGNGVVLRNWALFHISTQTNAHSPIEDPGGYSKYTSGVANDWWRIVDATANYSEEPLKVVATKDNEEKTENVTQQYTAPANTETMPVWESWIGNLYLERLITAVASLIVALIGTAVPVFFGFLTAVYGISITLMMAFAPLMFLFGCWSGKGWDIFKGWAELIVNTLIKRIITGVLLVLSIVFTATAIDLMDDFGWWIGVLMLMLLSIIIFRVRKKIINAVAVARFAGADLTRTSSALGNKFGSFTKTATRTTGSAIAGGITAQKAGGSFATGAKVGIRNEMKTVSGRNAFMRQATASYDATLRQSGKEHSGSALNDKTRCAHCRQYLTDLGNSQAFTDGSGNYYCESCAYTTREVMDEQLDAVFIPSKDDEELKKQKKDRADSPDTYKEPPANGGENSYDILTTWVKEEKASQNAIQAGQVPTANRTVTPDIDETERLKLMRDILEERTEEFFYAYKNYADGKVRASAPKLPAEIRPYLSTDAKNKLKEAMQNDDADQIEYDKQYAMKILQNAWFEWFMDNEYLNNVDGDDIKITIDQLLSDDKYK